MAESLTAQPIGSAPVSDFERLLLKEPSEFDKLLERPLRPTASSAKSDFERLLEKEFKPAQASTMKPKVKFRAKLGVSRGSDELIGLVMVGAELWAFTEALREEQALRLGFEGASDFNKAREDVSIGAEFATLAEIVLTDVKKSIWVPPAKKRKKRKRTVIYGWTRK